MSLTSQEVSKLYERLDFRFEVADKHDDISCNTTTEEDSSAKTKSDEDHLQGFKQVAIVLLRDLRTCQGDGLDDQLVCFASIAEMLRLRAGKAINAQLEFYMNVIVPNIVKTLMGRYWVNDAMSLHINQIFQSVIRLAVAFLSQEGDGALRVLISIFDNESQFYLLHGDSDFIDKSFGERGKGGAVDVNPAVGEQVRSLRSLPPLEHSDPRYHAFFSRLVGIIADENSKDTHSSHFQSHPFFLVHCYFHPLQIDEDHVYVARDVSIHKYLRDNINFFGRCGGFAAWVEQLRVLRERAAKTLTPHRIFMLLQPLRQVAQFLDPRFFATIIINTKHLSVGALRDMLGNDDVLTDTSLREFSVLITSVEEILFEVMEEEVTATVEALHVNMAVAFIRSPKVKFERRLNGLKHAADIIEHVERRHKTRQHRKLLREHDGLGVTSKNWVSAESDDIDDVGLTATALVTLLKQMDVIGLVAGKGLKPALIERATPILTFVASHDTLSVQDVDRLWRSAQDSSKHESCIEAITDSLLKIVPVLSSHTDSRMVRFVLDELQRVMRRTGHGESDAGVAFDQSKLAMLADVARHARAEDVRVRAVHMIWQVSCDLTGDEEQDGGKRPATSEPNASFNPLSSTGDPAVIRTAAATLQSILRELSTPPSAEGVRFRIGFAERCVGNIRRQVAVPQSMHTLCKIIESFPERSWFADDRGEASSRLLSLSQSGLIEMLSDSQRLSAVALDDIAHFVSTLVLDVEQRRKDSFTKAKGQHCSFVVRPDYCRRGSAVPHIEELSIRLNFIQFVVKRAPVQLALTPHYAEALWRHVIDRAVSPAQRSIAFSWLMRAVADGRDSGSLSGVAEGEVRTAFGPSTPAAVRSMDLRRRTPSIFTRKAIVFLFEKKLCSAIKSGGLMVHSSTPEDDDFVLDAFACFGHLFSIVNAEALQR